MTEGEREVRNVHQRKLAVMRRCDAIKPDKTHPKFGFAYNSIQNISNHLRVFCADEGLDIEPTIEGDEVYVHLINADEPSQRWTNRFPLIPEDKGHAFSIKFALVRTFLIGDGEEGDEAEMAQKSAQRRPEPLKRPEPRPIPAPEQASKWPDDEEPTAVDVNAELREQAVALAAEYLMKTNAQAKKASATALDRRAREWVDKLYEKNWGGGVENATGEDLEHLIDAIRRFLDAK